MTIREGYKLNEVECKEKGEHKYYWGYSAVTTLSLSKPTKENPEIETCIYCGHERRSYYLPKVVEE